MQHRRSGAGARRLHSKRIVQCAVDPIVFLSLSGEDSAIYHQNAANQGVRAQRLSLDVLSLAEASVGRAWLSLRLRLCLSGGAAVAARPARDTMDEPQGREVSRRPRRPRRAALALQSVACVAAALAPAPVGANTP